MHTRDEVLRWTSEKKRRWNKSQITSGIFYWCFLKCNCCKKKRRLFLQYVICFSSINKFFLHHTSKWMNVLSLCLGRSSWNTYSVCNELNKLWHWRRHFASNFIYLVINEAFRVWKLSRLKCLVILSTHEHTQTHELHTHVSILAPDSRFIRQFLHAATKTT